MSVQASAREPSCDHNVCLNKKQETGVIIMSLTKHLDYINFSAMKKECTQDFVDLCLMQTGLV